MKIVFFSSDIEIVDEWKSKNSLKGTASSYDLLSLKKTLSIISEPYILIADYDTMSQSISKLIATNKLPRNTIVLEKVPEITSGKMLIAHGVKAYGNSRMSPANFTQMIKTVEDGKVWTYPELTTSLIKDSGISSINEDASTLIQNRLSPKEIEVIYLILDGLTNDAIAKELDITTRTAKAHVGSIFSKLHVSDRISLVLLLK
ncbi:MAG: LuxR C-terminal-related transcriptional regulator [Sulfurimonas sp.]